MPLGARSGAQFGRQVQRAELVGPDGNSGSGFFFFQKANASAGRASRDLTHPPVEI
jgi:hypothetical protein